MVEFAYTLYLKLTFPPKCVILYYRDFLKLLYYPLLHDGWEQSGIKLPEKKYYLSIRS